MNPRPFVVPVTSTSWPTANVSALMKLDLPAGVDVEIKAFGKDHKA